MIGRLVAVALCWLLCLAGNAVANSTIALEHYQLLPNEPGQTIEIWVAGTEEIMGVNFFAQIGDGLSGPLITEIDLLDGTIFESNNWGQWAFVTLPSPSADAYTMTDLSASSPTVLANGLLARITIDTMGFDGGSWPLRLTDTLHGTTAFLDGALAEHSVDVNLGSVSIIPEPVSLVGIAMAALAVWGYTRRCRGEPRPGRRVTG